VKLAHRGPGHRHVPGVRGVEPPAEDADPGPPGHRRGR
jgi:hypothetical protein